MNDTSGSHLPATAPARFAAGIEDVIILPLVVIAAGARKLLRLALSALIHILDWLFPILLELARFPLFTLRIIGDGGGNTFTYGNNVINFGSNPIEFQLDVGIGSISVTRVPSMDSICQRRRA